MAELPLSDSVSSLLYFNNNALRFKGKVVLSASFCHCHHRQALPAVTVVAAVHTVRQNEYNLHFKTK